MNKAVQDPLIASIGANESTTEVGVDTDEDERKMRWKPIYTYILLLILFCIFGVVYGQVFAKEKLSFCQTVYFLIVTLMTVGYGDVAFDTENERLYGVFYVVVGASVVGNVFPAIIGYIAGGAHEPDDEDWEQIEHGGWKKDASPIFEDKASAIKHIKQNHFQNRKDMVTDVLKQVGQMLLLILAGTLIMMWLENWTFVSSLYFTLVTSTTVGYGDLTPVTCFGMIVTSIFIIVAVYFVANVMGLLSALPVDLRREQLSYDVLEQFGDNLDPYELERLEHSRLMSFIRNGDPAHAQTKAVTMPEFVLWMLIKQRKVDSASVEAAMRVYHCMQSEGVPVPVPRPIEGEDDSYCSIG